MNNNLEATVCLLLTTTNSLKLRLCKSPDCADGLYDVSMRFRLEPNKQAQDAIIAEAKQQLGIEINPNNLRCFHIRQDVAEQKLILFFRADTFARLPNDEGPDKLSSLRNFCLDDLPKNIVPYLPDVFYLWQRNITYSSTNPQLNAS